MKIILKSYENLSTKPTVRRTNQNKLMDYCVPKRRKIISIISM